MLILVLFLQNMLTYELFKHSKISYGNIREVKKVLSELKLNYFLSSAW